MKTAKDIIRLLGMKPHPEADTFVFGLPGNPVSAFVCTVRLASRLMQRLRGDEVVRDKFIETTLLQPLEANGAREFYQPVVIKPEGCLPLSWKGSADVYTLAKANGLLVRAENDSAQPAGARVRVLEV